jgi:O-antigen biosynthesis protein WbqP
MTVLYKKVSKNVNGNRKAVNTSKKVSIYRDIIKRYIDIVLSAIKIDSKGPVFFKQKRVGVSKKHFQILKFRTMKIDTPANAPTHQLQSPDKYITRVGKFLRKYSLDELPQLFNIIKGDMSIVGPRPALWNQFDLIEERDKYGANDVLPGLTGWAQINGRDELEIPVKAKLDGEYVKNLSFSFDMKCILKTVTSVVKHDGVVEGGTGKIRNR